MALRPRMFPETSPLITYTRGAGDGVTFFGLRGRRGQAQGRDAAGMAQTGGRDGVAAGDFGFTLFRVSGSLKPHLNASWPCPRRPRESKTVSIASRGQRSSGSALI